MKKPGSNSGDNGGIFQETGPRGARYDNYATVRDDERMPPTSAPGRGWSQIRRTPNSKR